MNLEEIANMTTEELAALGDAISKALVLKKAQKMKNETCVQHTDMRLRDQYGRLLTDEEIWDQEHPLIRKPYGFTEVYTVFGSDPVRKVWTKEEVEAYNKPIEEAWLAEKRKVFPDAQLPKLHDTGRRPAFKPERGMR